MTTSVENTIRNTIAGALPGHVTDSYGSYIEPVARALETREAFLVDGILKAAQDNGVSVATVQDVLSELGMHMPVVAPEPEETYGAPEPVDPTSVEARVTVIEGKLDQLINLAERHLGASV